jgi:hypothetical protein
MQAIRIGFPLAAHVRVSIAFSGGHAMLQCVAKFQDFGHVVLSALPWS